MKLTLTYEDILQQREEYIDMLRAFSVSKKEQWRRVPHLALEADGRTGHSGTYALAATKGYWQIESSISHGYYGVYVDCHSGELVNPFTIKDKIIEPARWTSLILVKPKEIDADEIVKSLEEQARKPYGSYYNPEEKDAWREGMRDKFNVQQIFTRQS